MNSAAQLEIHGFPMNEPFSKKQGPVVLPKLSKQRTSSQTLPNTISGKLHVAKSDDSYRHGARKNMFCNPTQSFWDIVRLCVNTEEKTNTAW